MELEERDELRRDLSDVIDQDQAAVLKSAVGELDLENYEDILGGNRKPQSKISLALSWGGMFFGFYLLYQEFALQKKIRRSPAQRPSRAYIPLILNGAFGSLLIIMNAMHLRRSMGSEYPNQTKTQSTT